MGIDPAGAAAGAAAGACTDARDRPSGVEYSYTVATALGGCGRFGTLEPASACSHLLRRPSSRVPTCPCLSRDASCDPEPKRPSLKPRASSQDLADPSFILRNIDLGRSCCYRGDSRVAQGYLQRKEFQVERGVCSSVVRLVGFVPVGRTGSCVRRMLPTVHEDKYCWQSRNR